MKITDIIEQPIAIDIDDVKTIDFNTLPDFKNNVKFQFHSTYNEHKLYKSSDGVYVLYDPDETNIVFYINVNFITVNSIEYPYVGFIRVSPDYHSKGFVLHFYLNILLKQYNMVFSDQQQSKDGTSVWIKLFENKSPKHEFGVYSTKTNNFKPITNKTDIRQHLLTLNAPYERFYIREL